MPAHPGGGRRASPHLAVYVVQFLPRPRDSSWGGRRRRLSAYPIIGNWQSKGCYARQIVEVSVGRDRQARSSDFDPGLNASLEQVEASHQRPARFRSELYASALELI